MTTVWTDRSRIETYQRCPTSPRAEISLDIAVIAKNSEPWGVAMCLEPRIESPAADQGALVVGLPSSHVVYVKDILVGNLAHVADIATIGRKCRIFIGYASFSGLLEPSPLMVVSASSGEYALTELWFTPITIFESLAVLGFIAMIAFESTLIILLRMFVLPLLDARDVTLFTGKPVSCNPTPSGISVELVKGFYFVARLAFYGHACILT